MTRVAGQVLILTTGFMASRPGFRTTVSHEKTGTKKTGTKKTGTKKTGTKNPERKNPDPKTLAVTRPTMFDIFEQFVAISFKPVE